MSAWEYIKSDFEAAMRNDPAIPKGIRGVLEVVLCTPGFLAITFHRAFHFMHSTMHIPVLPRGSYEIQMDFTRTGGEGMIGLLVPVGGQRCVVVLDCRPGIHGIDMVAGQRADNNPTTARGAIQTGRTYKLEIKVVPEDAEASITVHLDERPWLFYRGPTQDLQLHKEFTIRAGGGMALLTRCSVAIHSLQLRPRSGQVLLLDSPAGTKSAEKK